VTEIDLLTVLRSEVPTQVTAEAERLFAAAFDPHRTIGGTAANTRHRATPRFGWPGLSRLALVTGLAAAAGTGIVVATTQHPAGNHPAALASAGRPTSTSGPATPGGTATGPLTVQDLAYRASAAALGAPTVRPGQWIYLKTVTEGLPGQPAGPQSHELWMTADGSRSAVIRDGRVKVFAEPPTDITYAELVKFSGDPRGLVEYVHRREASIHPGTAGENWFWTFDAMNQVFAAYLLPPKAAATVFQAMPYVPGITAEKEAKGSAFSLADGLGLSDKLVLDPVSYRVTSLHIHFTYVPSRNIDVAFLAQVPVSGPGVRH
jgi:hypothetical protein